MPMTKDPYAGSLILQGFAQVYTWTGENDRALELLRVLVQMPAYLSYGYLRTDPAWEPLRADDRFKEILGSIAPK